MREAISPVVWGNAVRCVGSPSGTVEQSIDVFISESRRFTDRMFRKWINDSRSLSAQIIESAHISLPTIRSSLPRKLGA
jgi:hypothetical protein